MRGRLKLMKKRVNGKKSRWETNSIKRQIRMLLFWFSNLFCICWVLPFIKFFCVIAKQIFSLSVIANYEFVIKFSTAAFKHTRTWNETKNENAKGLTLCKLDFPPQTPRITLASLFFKNKTENLNYHLKSKQFCPPKEGLARYRFPCAWEVANREGPAYLTGIQIKYKQRQSGAEEQAVARITKTKFKPPASTQWGSFTVCRRLTSPKAVRINGIARFKWSQRRRRKIMGNIYVK